jgi:hypothetical protein
VKILLTLKDPDGVDNCVKQAATDSLAEAKLEEDELDAVMEYRVEKIQNAIKPWVEYGEYLTVEVDTETGTCVVIPVNQR